MKSLLFAAFVLSLILMVSAQCDINAVSTCVQDYLNMVSLYAGNNYHCNNYMHEVCMVFAQNFFTRRKFSPPALTCL